MSGRRNRLFVCVPTDRTGVCRASVLGAGGIRCFRYLVGMFRQICLLGIGVSADRACVCYAASFGAGGICAVRYLVGMLTGRRDCFLLGFSCKAVLIFRVPVRCARRIYCCDCFPCSFDLRVRVCFGGAGISFLRIGAVVGCRCRSITAL